ncbi:sugar-transfer associated ATP-grasp domain-containing protein, partial [Micrococcus sp. SIMBA_144]
LVQNKLLQKVYPASINTIRVHTYYNKKADEVKIISALIRFGASGRIVDNGNLFVPIDINKWKLKKVGYSFLKNGGHTYLYHPESNIFFNNYQLPYGKSIEELVCRAGKLFKNEFIGWDIAITPHGISIIEGNGNPHLIMAQIACEGFRA